MKRRKLVLNKVLVFKEKVGRIQPKLLIPLICSIIVLSLFLISKKFLLDRATNPRVLCYILLSRQKVKAGVVIQETWGRHCDKIIFFGNYHTKELPMTILEGREGYPFLWNKTKSALVYLSKRFMDFDWFLKADHDTFVLIQNLKRFVQPLNPEELLWFGYKLKDPSKNSYMSGGAGYVLSRGGLGRIGSILTDSTGKTLNSNCNFNHSVGYEDLELGKCVLAAGIRTVETHDMNGRQRFLPLPLSFFLSKNISRLHWILNQAWNPIIMGDKCCSSEELITMHKISPMEMKTLYFLLYHTSK